MEVLLAVALDHFVLVVVRVLKGPTQADESVKRLRRLVHCQWCEERVFLKHGNMVDGGFRPGLDPCTGGKCVTDGLSVVPDTLPCSCHGSLPGKTAVQLGPLW